MTGTARSAVAGLGRVGVVAVIRAADAEQAHRCADALVRGGVYGIEITFTTPGAARAIAAVRAAHDADVVVGAGTLTSNEQVDDAVAAGADFLVSPGTRPALASHMVMSGRATLLGALTPSEVMLAQESAADAVKIFPASLGGPAHLRALRGPFPDLLAVPTGGVSPGNLDEWFAAGAHAVGAGSDLCPNSVLAAGDWDEITRRAGVYRDALVAVRGG